MPPCDGISVFRMKFKMKSVDQAGLSDLLAKPTRVGRTSKGADLIDEFLSSNSLAAIVDLGSTKERNAVAISAANHVRGTETVWVKKQGGGSGTELLLINLTKADAATKKAYQDRPRVGRRPAGQS